MLRKPKHKKLPMLNKPPKTTSEIENAFLSNCFFQFDIKLKVDPKYELNLLFGQFINFIKK